MKMNSKLKGRGSREEFEREQTQRILEKDRQKHYESLDGERVKETDFEPARSVEGWILIASNINEECTEDDILDKLMDFGEIKNLQLPIDRRTGYIKGYALVQFEHKSDAQQAIDNLNEKEFMSQTLRVDWAFQSRPSVR